MPAIVGMIGKAEQPLLDRMCEAVKHDPQSIIAKHIDPSGLFAAGEVHTDSRRRQSMFFNAEKTICAFMDGWIFNNKTSNMVFQGRGEQLGFCIELYQEHGKDFVKHLNGSFVVVICDLQNKVVVIANDKYGLLPLYIYHNTDKKYLLFASEIKAVLKDGEFNKELDWDAVAMHFVFDTIYGDVTFFKHAKPLPAATVLTCDLNTSEVQLTCYDDFEYSREYDKDKLQAEIKQNFKDFMHALSRFADENGYSTAISLSGGLDSRILLASAGFPLKTFTFGAEGSAEIKIAGRVAAKANAAHTPVILDAATFLATGEKTVRLLDGRVNFRECCNLVIPQKCKDSVDILLVGLCIGELMGGQKLYERKIFEIAGIDELTDWVYKKRGHGFTEEMLAELFVPEYHQRVRNRAYGCLHKELSQTGQKSCLDAFRFFSLRNDIRKLFLLTRGYATRFAMSPLFNNTVMNSLLKIPPEYQYKLRFILSFFKKAFPELSTIVYQKTGMPVNAPFFLHRLSYYFKNGLKMTLEKLKKTMKTPIEYKGGNPDINEWTRSNKQIRDFIKEVLLSEKTLSRGYFNKAFIEKLLDDHANYIKNYSTQLFILVTFELWHRYFIDES